MSYKVFVLKGRLVISKNKIIETGVAVLYSINNRKDLGVYGANAINFCVSLLLRLLFSLKCRNQNCENPYQNHQTKNEEVTKKCTYLRKIMLHFLKFLP